MWEGVFSKSKRIMMLESEVDILRRELESYKHFRKKDDERNYEKITKCIAKTAFVEVQIEEAMMPLKRRIDTLEQQIADGMNREEEVLSNDNISIGGISKGDLVCNKKHPRNIMVVERLDQDGITIVNAVNVEFYAVWENSKPFLDKWKRLAKKENLE